ARFVMTAPDCITMPPASVKKAMPPFSSVRPTNATVAGLTKLSVAPVSTIVLPVPLITPEPQENFPRTVRVPLPIRVGLLSASPNVTSAQSAAVFRVTVTLVLMMAVSFVLGARLGFQLLAVFQSPLAVFVQMNTMGANRAYTVLSRVITTLTGLLRVRRSPSHAWKMPLVGGTAVSVTLW